MLQLLLIIPLIGAGALLPFSTGAKTSPLASYLGLNSEARMKQVALFASLVNFIISLIVWAQFDSSVSHYQFQEEFTQISFCHLHLGIDGISLYFVLLTTFITPICILSNWHDIKVGLKYFLIAFLVLETLQIAVFVVLDLLLFYIFFESVLIPLFLIVGIWGASEARIRAAFLLFLYTLAGSLFMLLAIMVIYYNVGSTDFTVLSLQQISLESQKILWIGFFIAFAVKTPLFPFHIWLPRAHSEAPLAGSILLAAIILKFPVYGVMRILLQILPDATNYFSPLVQTIAVISLIYASLATIIQHDTKALVAYSSVAHMGVIMLGLFSNTITGIEGAILLSLAHGFVSPGLFICVGGVLYNRYHTRTIAYYRGLVLTMPVFTILFFLFTIANSGIPLTLNWVGEFLSLNGMWDRNPVISALGASGILFSACYSIWLYNRISYGSFSPYLTVTNDVTRREFILLFSLVIPVVLFGIFPNVILDALHFSVSTLLYNTTTPLFTPLDLEMDSSLLSFVPLVFTKQENKFNEWFRGFCDGESCFSIAPKSNKPFSFEFSFNPPTVGCLYFFGGAQRSWVTRGVPKQLFEQLFGSPDGFKFLASTMLVLKIQTLKISLKKCSFGTF
ncbi:NADH dehydrogenase subunit 4 (mitochondrion) [Rhizoctonia solani AG-1 IB]|jgi:NADH-ubiquinone oxidoreductase chain 4|uniref:NADH-ubiquinone oxidoreductase chain 4 n=2 Tax=Rhizoctonia solani TaxID=456999 RepID=A0A8E8GQT8_9AGAM|nr:NADH dehydrogenase [Rhizoctonia solani]CCO27464.1 NADH dehydrogenase subunit 4 [Rhizoctonia solani AG-1 IB]